MHALQHLGEQHLTVRDMSTYDGPDCYVDGITAEGLRAAGQWPSPEAAVDRFIAAIDEQINNTAEGTPRLSRLRTLRESVTGIGREVLVEVMGAVVTGRIPM